MARITPNRDRSQRRQRQQRRAEQMLREMQRTLTSPTPRTHRQLQEQANRISRLVSSSPGFSRQAAELTRRLRQLTDSGELSIANQVLGAFDDSRGNLVRDWLKSASGRQALRAMSDEIQRTIDIVNQIDPEEAGRADAPTPEQLGGRRIPDPGERLPALTQPQPQQPPQPRRPPRPPEPPEPPPEPESPHRNVTVLPDGRWRIRGPGYNRVLSPDHAALTGEMVPAVSSNVHSYGYQFDFDRPTHGRLIVRYLQRDRSGRSAGKVPGPTYEYLRVHPDFFDDMLRAGSKGKWVWDELRIRGTIAGHQYSYNLTRAAQRYLPRRARVVRGRQVLERRRRVAMFSTGRETLVSPLPTTVVGPYRPSVHRPNIGNPDRSAARRR